MIDPKQIEEWRALAAAASARAQPAAEQSFLKFEAGGVHYSLDAVLSFAVLGNAARDAIPTLLAEREELLARVSALEALVGTVRGLIVGDAVNVADISVEQHSRDIVGRHTAALALLREVEWVNTDDWGTGGSCACCRSPRGHGHAPDCRLAALLKG